LSQCGSAYADAISPEDVQAVRQARYEYNVLEQLGQEAWSAPITGD